MKTAVITGSSRGLGLEMAKCFRKRGMNVVLNGVNYLVTKILRNTKNNVHIQWLTTGKVMWKFMTAGFNKRNFFA